MTRSQYLKRLKQTRKRMLKRYGNKMCREIDARCSNCQAQAFIGFLNTMIDAYEHNKI